MAAELEWTVLFDDSTDPGRVVDPATECSYEGPRVFTGPGAERKAAYLAWKLNGRGPDLMPHNIRARVDAFLTA